MRREEPRAVHLDLEQCLLEHGQAMVLRARDGHAAEPRDGELAVRLAVDDFHPEPRAERLDGRAVVRLLQRDDVRVLLAQHVLDRVERPSPPFQMFQVRTRAGARYCSRGKVVRRLRARRRCRARGRGGSA